MAGNLNSLYRTVKTYTILPSGGKFYTPDVIDLVDNTGEVGIRSMTASDELAFKNPDALLNGEAMRTALISCVDGLKKPEKLLANDVEALIVGMRIATYGEQMDITVTCPSCKNDNTYGIELPTILNTMGTLSNSYSVDISNGTVVTIRPYLYEDNLKVSLATFEQTRAIRELEARVASEDEKLKVFDMSFKAIMKTNIEMLANAIISIHNDEHEISVEHTKETHNDILEFIKNIDKVDSDIIINKLKEINEIGIIKKMNVVCDHCKHEWECPIEFDPVSFLSGS